MKKLDNYINYIFSDYPENNEIIEIKKELKFNLEQRVNDYKEEGLSEEVAIEKTIDSIGDIDELVSSFGINTDISEYSREVNNYCEILIELDNAFKDYNPKNALLISLGVFILLIALGLCGTFSVMNKSDVVVTFTLFLGIMIAVPLFIYSGFRAAKYDLTKVDYSEEEIATFEKDKQVIELKRQLKKDYNIDDNKTNIYTIVGICLCIFAVTLAGVASQMGVQYEKFVPILFFSFIALGVFLIIYNSMMKSYSLATASVLTEKREDKAGAIIMPIAVIIFLILGFVFNLWHPGWVVFPIGGILTGIVSSLTKK